MSAATSSAVHRDSVVELTLRETTTRCPVCVRQLKGFVREIDSKVYLCRTCPEHGSTQFLLSANGALYRDLERFYFEVLGKKDRPKGRITNYWVLSTNRCQMQCAFCQVEVESPWFEDMSLDDLRSVFAAYGKDKLTLSGGEATLHPNLAEFFTEAHARKLTTQLATNGVLLARPGYCETLAAAHVDEVRLSVESLRDGVSIPLYADKFQAPKLAALDNLARCKITTALSPTIFKGVNEALLVDALEYAKDRPLIKEISVNGFSWVGEGRGLKPEWMIMPDEMMDVLHRAYFQSARAEIFTFQKMLLTALQLMRVRLCLYTQIMVFVRTRAGLRPITEYMNMKRASVGMRLWERCARKPYPIQLIAFLLVGLASLRLRTATILGPLFRLFLSTLFGIKIRDYPYALLPVVLNTNCSTLTADESVGMQCMSGVVYKRHGTIAEGRSTEMLLNKEAEHQGRQAAGSAC